MRLRISIRGCVRPSVGQSCVFFVAYMLEDEKFVKNIRNNDTMSNYEVVASYVSPVTCLLLFGFKGDSKKSFVRLYRTALVLICQSRVSSCVSGLISEFWLYQPETKEYLDSRCISYSTSQAKTAEMDGNFFII